MDTAICMGSSIKFNNVDISAAGVHSFNLISDSGCDSTIILRVTLNDTFYVDIDTAICSGEVIEIAGKQISAAGHFTVPLMSQIGCDSTIVVNVQERSPDQLMYDTSFCRGDVIEFADSVISSPGNYTFSFSNRYGCDSLVELNVEMSEPTYSEFDTTICFGDSLMWNNNSYLDER